MKQAYDDADLERAIQAYKFFYPTVSGAAIVRGNATNRRRAEQGVRHSRLRAGSVGVHGELRHALWSADARPEHRAHWSSSSRRAR